MTPYEVYKTADLLKIKIPNLNPLLPSELGEDFYNWLSNCFNKIENVENIKKEVKNAFDAAYNQGYLDGLCQNIDNPRIILAGNKVITGTDYQLEEVKDQLNIMGESIFRFDDPLNIIYKNENKK